MLNKSTKFILSLVLVLLCVGAGEAATTYATDLLITKTDGIWTDSRAFTSIGAAIINIGALERDLYIASEESVVTLTVPANIRLHFLKTGAINNTGQLTINSQMIVAEDHQIFTGTGDIDFVDGTVVHSSWFADITTAIQLTEDDTLTILITEDDTISYKADVDLGDDVTLMWESAFILTIQVGTDFTNVKNIDAGNYQIFAGPGDIDFLDGSSLKLVWFPHLRTFNTWINAEEVTLIVSGSNTVDLDETLTDNITIDFAAESGQFVPDAGITVTINSPEHIIASRTQQIIDTTNNSTNPLLFTNPGIAYPEWWGVDGTADNVEINLAIASGGIVELVQDYSMSGTITLIAGSKIFSKTSSTLTAINSMDANLFINILLNKYRKVLISG